MGNGHSHQYLYGSHGIQGRRKTMEDASVLIPELKPNAAFFAIFDGHNGSLCSQFLSSHLPEVIREHPFLVSSPSLALSEAFADVDEAYLEYCRKHQVASGSTAICALMIGDDMYIANTGDSRCLVCQDATVVPLSSDHKPDNPEEKNRIIGNGGFVVSGRVQGILAVARAFGNPEFKNLDNPDTNLVTSSPDIKIWTKNETTEFLVMACDGLWDVMTNKMVVKFVRDRLIAGFHPQLICEHLADFAFNRGSGDNISIIILSFLTRNKIYYLRDHPSVLSNYGDGGNDNYWFGELKVPL